VLIFFYLSFFDFLIYCWGGQNKGLLWAGFVDKKCYRILLENSQKMATEKERGG
jgi:hypothetical protein